MADYPKDDNGKDCCWPFNNGSYFGPASSFPGTSYEYNGNLRWLICAYQKLVPAVEKLKQDVQDLVELYESIPGLISRQVAIAVSPVFERIKKLEERMAEWNKDISAKIEEQDRRLDRMLNVIASLEYYIATVKSLCFAYTDTQNAALKKEIYEYLGKIAKEWPPVRCPVDYQLEDINTALAHIYDAVRRGITFGRFNLLNITYGRFNGIAMSYRDFNTLGYDILSDEIDRRFYMYSPFTGKLTYWSKMILELYRLHFPGEKYEALNEAAITYQEFNDKNLDYETFNTTTWLTA